MTRCANFLFCILNVLSSGAFSMEKFDPCFDAYAELGLKPCCTTEELRVAYRKLATEFHPNRNPGDEAAYQKSLRIGRAWDLLHPPENREEYDKLRARHGVGVNGSPAQPSANKAHESDIADMRKVMSSEKIPEATAEKLVNAFSSTMDIKENAIFRRRVVEIAKRYTYADFGISERNLLLDFLGTRYFYEAELPTSELRQVVKDTDYAIDSRMWFSTKAMQIYASRHLTETKSIRSYVVLCIKMAKSSNGRFFKIVSREKGFQDEFFDPMLTFAKANGVSPEIFRQEVEEGMKSAAALSSDQTDSW